MSSNIIPLGSNNYQSNNFINSSYKPTKTDYYNSSINKTKNFTQEKPNFGKDSNFNAISYSYQAEIPNSNVIIDSNLKKVRVDSGKQQYITNTNLTEKNQYNINDDKIYQPNIKSNYSINQTINTFKKNENFISNENKNLTIPNTNIYTNQYKSIDGSDRINTIGNSSIKQNQSSNNSVDNKNVFENLAENPNKYIYRKKIDQYGNISINLNNKEYNQNSQNENISINSNTINPKDFSNNILKYSYGGEQNISSDKNKVLNEGIYENQNNDNNLNSAYFSKGNQNEKNKYENIRFSGNINERNKIDIENNDEKIENNNNNNNNNNNLNDLNMFPTGQDFYYDKNDFLNIGRQNNLTDIQNSFNLEDIDANKIFQTETNIDNRNNNDFITYEDLLINEKNNNYNNYNTYEINNQINNSNDYKIFNGNEINNTLYSTNDLNNIYKNNITEFSIIKKNINNEKKDLYKNQKKKKSFKINTKIVKKALLNKNQSNKINVKLPLDKNKSKNKNININLKHNKIVKEPTDNNSKINIKSKISSMKQIISKNNQKQPMNKMGKNSGHIRDVKDSKRKILSLDESLFQSIDENGIDETKKKVLQREIMPNNRFISFNNDRFMTQRNFSNNNNSELIFRDSQRLSYRKKLIQEANSNKSQQELFSKTQGRYFKNKKKELNIRLDDNSLSFHNNKIINNFDQSPFILTSKENKKKVFYSESRNIQKNKNIFIDPNNNLRKNSLYK